ncbi:hypothetical protein [Archangium lansingense]|uniref:Uncharacterized protein n=1 Tax=Archangium lansingense TaxID=2995310 RepID=A0ABT4AP90_9BACT|nr:hypothetical protein [Archangium lansinium]MCY1083510.1 hypothetical protein [Archangium lansinium]
MDQMEPIAERGAVSSVAPNQFELRGKDIRVSFSTTSITGDPLMHYRDRRREVNARGDEIRQVDVGIGTLVTIVLQSNAADAEGILFSVLIPNALITGKDQRVAIKTLGITTRTPGFIVPTTRQLETYSEVNLTGDGTFVVS